MFCSRAYFYTLICWKAQPLAADGGMLVEHKRDNDSLEISAFHPKQVMACNFFEKVQQFVNSSSEQKVTIGMILMMAKMTESRKKNDYLRNPI